MHYEKIGDKVTCIEEEIPFEIPDSWEWSRVGSISSLIQYGLSNPAKSEGNYHLLRITDIQDNAVNWDAVPYTQVSDNEIESFELKNDDILFARTGATVGKSFLVRATSVKSVFASYLIRIQTIEYIAARYLKLFFESGYYWRQITDKSVGIGQPNVNGTSLKNLLLPIPPYNSQVQISNSIDNFLVYADRIESEKADLDSIITQAKSKILDLAIRGKLVPQNPDDEPASILLERIRAVKEELIKQGKIKRDKNESYIFRSDDKSYYEKVGNHTTCIDTEIPFEIPENWMWVRLGNIGKWQSGVTPSRRNSAYYNGDIPWLKTGDLIDGVIYDIPEMITKLALSDTSLKINPIGSVLIAMYGATIGKIGILAIEAATNQACCACSCFCGVKNIFLFYYLLSQRADFIAKGAGGAQPNISKEKIVNTLMPFPPLEEQEKICKAIDLSLLHLLAIAENLK